MFDLTPLGTDEILPHLSCAGEQQKMTSLYVIVLV